MKSIGTMLSIVCLLAAAGLAIGVAVERQARVKLDQENKALRQELSRMGGLAAENQRLSSLVAQAQGSPSQPSKQPEGAAPADERLKELLRLQGEVEVLRQQSKELTTLREDTRQVRATRESGFKTPTVGQAAQGVSGAGSNEPGLEILRAEYWTAHTNMDVAAELRERIGGDGLKAVASNNIKGDPEFGQSKHLTVVYRVGGITRTNEFQEGDLVILPGQ
jgi:hypothetical protein